MATRFHRYPKLALFATLALGLCISCNSSSELQVNRLTKGSNDVSDGGFEAAINNLITTKDKNGDPAAIVGLRENNEIKNTAMADHIKQRGLEVLLEKLFEFTAPSDYKVEFSASYLTSGESQDCSAKDYRATEPTITDLLHYSGQNNICGQISPRFCLKLTSSALTGEMTYLKTPPVETSLLCPTASFTGVDVAAASDTSAADRTSVDLKIAAGDSVTRSLHKS